jgi:hypothetical protein
MINLTDLCPMRSWSSRTRMSRRICRSSWRTSFWCWFSQCKPDFNSMFSINYLYPIIIQHALFITKFNEIQSVRRSEINKKSCKIKWKAFSWNCNVKKYKWVSWKMNSRKVRARGIRRARNHMLLIIEP